MEDLSIMSAFDLISREVHEVKDLEARVRFLVAASPSNMHTVSQGWIFSDILVCCHMPRHRPNLLSGVYGALDRDDTFVLIHLLNLSRAGSKRHTLVDRFGWRAEPRVGMVFTLHHWANELLSWVVYWQSCEVSKPSDPLLLDMVTDALCS